MAEDAQKNRSEAPSEANEEELTQEELDQTSGGVLTNPTLKTPTTDKSGIATPITPLTGSGGEDR